MLSLCFGYQPLIAETETQITLKVMYEKCADQSFKNQYGSKYIDNNGDIYSEFLSKPINIKMLQDVEYDWMVEGCEDEYQNYPIKFKLKYS